MMEHRALTQSETLPHANTAVGILHRSGCFCVLAVRDIAAGELCFEIAGALVAKPSRYTVQIDEHVHVDVMPADLSLDKIDRSPWRFLNHGCEPNVAVRGRSVVALRAISRFEELVFDYNSTEFDMASPFTCRCGSRHCYGMVRGFRYLDPAQRERLRPLLAIWLLRRLEAETAGSNSAS